MRRRKERAPARGRRVCRFSFFAATHRGRPDPSEHTRMEEEPPIPVARRRTTTNPRSWTEVRDMPNQQGERGFATTSEDTNRLPRMNIRTCTAYLVAAFRELEKPMGAQTTKHAALAPLVLAFCKTNASGRDPEPRPSTVPWTWQGIFSCRNHLCSRLTAHVATVGSGRGKKRMAKSLVINKCPLPRLAYLIAHYVTTVFITF